MAPSGLLLLLLLGLLSSAGSLPPPRTSFLLHSADRPVVLFSLPDVHNTTTLLLSDDGSTLYVGAQNALLSLDVSVSDVIKLKKKVDWSPSEREINDCTIKDKNPTVDCPNFVRVLQLINSTYLYACGSYAYSPQDAYIDTDSFSLVRRGSAKGRCPFSPFQRNTAVAVDGELFTATTSDFRGVKPQISRHFSKDGRPDVSQDSSVSLLDEPTFISSSLDPSDRKLYFFFSEVGKEFSFVDELRIPRVAQVCKDDVGGQRTLQRKWTSFVKAPLLCQSSKQLPFNVLQDVFTLQPPEGSDTSDTLFYGVFTSQWSTRPESAVCVFRLQDVKQVFSGSYRTFDMQTHQWSPMLERHSYLGKCGLDSASDSELMEVKRSFLTSGSVKPHGPGPLVVSSEQQYSRVAAMTTQAANGKQYTILFLLTESGFLHKVGLFDQGVHVIEEIQVFTQPQRVKSIVLSSSKGVLYIGSSEGVTAVPVARCSIYRSCSQCVLARDPLCGWSRSRRLCSSLDGSEEDIAQDLEDGNVEEECQGQTELRQDTIMNVKVNAVVRLQCQKPSNLATVTWTSTHLRNLEESLFIQSADGSLSFYATADTFGTYRCEAQEGGYKEVVASYDIRQTASPRSTAPKATGYHEHAAGDEPYEDIETETPLISATQPASNTEHNTMEDHIDKVTTNLKDETVFNGDETNINGDKTVFFGNKTDFNGDETNINGDKTDSNEEKPGLKSSSEGKSDAQSDDKSPGHPEMPTTQKSYYGELVAVSLLLAVCCFVLIFGGLYMWRHKKDPKKESLPLCPEDGKTNRLMESVPSPSGLEESGVKQ